MQRGSRSVSRRVVAGAGMALALASAGCDLAYPEVVVVNRMGAHVLVRNPSFNGCAWSLVLADGEATPPGRCLPGEDRVHFQKLDMDQEAGTAEPATWFNYQTISSKHVSYGSFHVFEIRLDEIEQDFSTPGPYGH